VIVVVVILSVLVIALSVALVWSVRLNLKQSEFVERFENNYEDAQNVLNDAYFAIEDALSKPVLMDDPITRRVLATIRAAQRSVLTAARLVTMQENENEEENENR